MKKQRIAAAFMAAIMSFSTFSSSVIADEAILANVSSEEAVLSGSAVAETADAADVEEENEEVADIVTFADGFKSGGMGSIGKNFSVTETSDGATLAVTAQNKGKLSNGDDSYAYYAYQVPLANDFSMSATITVNNYNTLFAGTTNTNQSSFGIVGFDEIYSGSNNTSNQLFLMAYAEKSSSSAAEMVAAKRHKGDSEKTILGSMSDSFGIKSAGGPFKVSIVKAGTNYVIKCDDKEVTVSDPDLFTADPYFGFFVARDASITVSDLQFSVDEKTVRDIKVVTPPAKTTYKIGEKVDLTGAEIEVTYTDGSTEIVDNNNVVVSDFDSSSKGSRIMYVNKGVVSAPIDYTIVSDGVVSINLLSEPYINEYSVDMYFSTDGISAEAVIDTGEVIEMIYEGDYKEESASESEKRAPKYAFYLDGEKVDDTYIISEKNVGDKQVEVRAISSDSIEANDVKATYDVTITPERLTSLGIIAKPINVEFFTGQTFDYSGLIVKGIYTDAQGNTKESRLKEKDYIVEAPSLATAGTKTVNIVSAQNSSVKTSYDIDVFEKNFIEYTIKEYPIMTVQQGEAFDPKGLVVGAYFISGEVDAIPEDQYTLDLSQFDSSAVGKTTVNVVVNGTYGQATLPLEITVREKSEQIWKSAAFGQSTSTSSEKVTLNDDGSVTVYAAADSGKITADHDGIAYYYTRVPAEDNFTISGTVKVDYYLKNNDDTGRSGQEAFGIMLRDAIPLVDKNVDLSGAKNLSQQIDIMKQYDAVADMNDALIGEDGEPVVSQVAKVFSSNMALLGGYSGTSWPSDPNAISYVKNSTINRINLVGRVGTLDYLLGGGAEKIGPYKLSSTFPAVGNMYDITMKKVGNGIYAKCYDYQTGETQETYQYFGEGFINSLDPNNMYIGFAAARGATITVSDYELHVTDPSTDVQEYVVTEAAKIPSVSVESSKFTTDEDYTLLLKAGNKLGGTVTIKQNGKIVARDELIANKNSSFFVTLNRNAVNNFTVIYTPNPADNISSTNDVITSFEITHKDAVNTSSVIYAGPDGTPAAAGTREDPLDIQSAIGYARSGQTVICLEGVYYPRTNIDIPVTQYGYSVEPIVLKADDGKDVELNFGDELGGFVVRANWWYIKGIDITHTADNQKGFQLAGNNCVVEDCKFHDNGDTGFQISRIGDGGNTIDEWPTDNLVLNCESYNNADPAGINADGYGAKLTVGTGNVFERCVSHHNLDDGWDTYTKLGSGAIGAVTLENCASYRQGYVLNEDGSDANRKKGGNNGYKMGGENVAVQHYLKDCLSFENGANGVTTNSNPHIKIRNLISYNNSGAGFSLYTANSKSNYNIDVKGAVNYKSAKDTLGTVTTDTKYENHAELPIISDDNYFNLGSGYVNASGDAVTDDFFVSVDRNSSLVGNRYPQDEDGNFIFGDYLARVTPFVHDAADEVVLPTINTESASSSDVTTEATTENGSEATTKRSSGGGGGGGGSSTSKSGTSSSLSTTTEADTEETTESVTKVTENNVEPTTEESKDLFNDIADKPWAVDAINSLAEFGVIRGVGENKFAPDASCKRADFVIMLVNSLGIEGTATDNFNDVAENKYYYNYIGLAKEAGIVKGYGDGNFGPEKLCTRAELMVMVASALGLTGDEAVLDRFSDANEIPTWARPYVAALVEAGIVNGSNGNINANVNITRAEVAVIMFNVISRDSL